MLSLHGAGCPCFCYAVYIAAVLCTHEAHLVCNCSTCPGQCRLPLACRLVNNYKRSSAAWLSGHRMHACSKRALCTSIPLVVDP